MQIQPFINLFVLCVVSVACSATTRAETPEKIAPSFSQTIRPILSDRCFACHGPDSESRAADLRLDQPDGDGGAYETAIVPGSVEESELWARINSDDPDVVMPPSDSHHKPLNKEEKGLIRRWIESGAKYETHWSFQPLKRPAAPNAEASDWSDKTIDRFVFRRLQERGLSPSPEADPRTLIRRITFDLTGLPPTRDEIRRFVDASATSSELAWEALVDELLDRPEYGEHRTRYWLDLVRFADTNGMHKDFYRNHIAYRDWVIRAFNDNLRYDEFVSYQMAGDLYKDPTRDQLVASGFHRLHLIIDRGTALPEESRVKNVLDRVTAVGTAFMGLTVQCAQCHDHKYDPISQKEFFSLYAFFNNIDANPETTGRPAHGLQEPIARWPTLEQTAELKKTNDRLVELRADLNNVEKQIKEVDQQTKSSDKTQSDESRSDNTSSGTELKALTQQKASLQKRIGKIDGDRKRIEASVDRAMVMRERKDIRPTHVLIRGQYDAPGELVQRGTPKFLPAMNHASDVASRMDLAKWLVDPKNPLTARVAVNRFWQSFFGVGLVKTSEDFGNQGTVPSHPDLLDELAVGFVDSDWNVKALLKRIVMSKTYRQASRGTVEQFRQDSENRMLARGPRYRLDAEMIRDQILATSGSLSKEMFGSSVKPPQPDGLWRAVSMTNERFRPDKGDAIVRRSVYTFWKRAMPPPQMTILNAPFRDSCIARRERTNTPTQALLLLNESEYLNASRRLAQLTLKHPAAERLQVMWETVTGKLPDAGEKEILESLLADMLQKYTEDTGLAESICQGAELKSTSERAEVAAWTMVASTLYNLDITKTKD